MPFEQLVAHLQPERDLSQNPLFQVLLSLEPPLPPLDHGWTLSQTHVDTDTAKFDLSLELDERPEGIIGRCEYSADLFDAATIARLLEHWQVLLASVARDPGQHLGEVPLVTAAERD